MVSTVMQMPKKNNIHTTIEFLRKMRQNLGDLTAKNWGLSTYNLTKALLPALKAVYKSKTP